MSRKGHKHHNQKSKGVVAGAPDFSNEEAMEALKTDILKECERLAFGQARSIYNLCQMTKELAELRKGRLLDIQTDDSARTPQRQ